MTSAQQAVAEAHRHEWARLLAVTVRVTRDLDLAEECVQDAYAAALASWTRDGVPARPGAWLTTAARHNALDALRRARTLRSKLHLLVEPDVAAEPGPHDDRLRLVFLCCHPALAIEAQVALTLRLVCGVTSRTSRARSWSPSRPWRPGSPGPRRRSWRPGSRSGCRLPPSCRTGWTPRSPRSTCSSPPVTPRRRDPR